MENQFEISIKAQPPHFSFARLRTALRWAGLRITMQERFYTPDSPPVGAWYAQIANEVDENGKEHSVIRGFAYRAVAGLGPVWKLRAYPARTVSNAALAAGLLAAGLAASAVVAILCATGIL